MKLPNKVYDHLKWALTIAAPASITLINTLAPIYHFNSDAITATIAAITTFAGSLFMISSTQYKKGDKK